MTRSKKEVGFRIGEKVPWWRDRFGRSGGKIFRMIRVPWVNDIQVCITNGDILTTSIILASVFVPKNKEYWKTINTNP